MFLLNFTSLTGRDFVTLCLTVCWQFVLLILGLSEFLSESKVTNNTLKHKHTAERRGEKMYCFVFSAVLSVLTVSDSALKGFSYVRDEKDYMHFSAQIITIFHLDEAAEKMGPL